MLRLPAPVRIFLCLAAVDMRRSFDGLATSQKPTRYSRIRGRTSVGSAASVTYHWGRVAFWASPNGRLRQTAVRPLPDTYPFALWSNWSTMRPS